MYLIIGIWGGSNRIYATIKFVLYTLVGSLLMLVAILALAWTYQSATGSWEGAFDYEALVAFGFDKSLQFWAFLGFFLAFAIKVPMWPFHTWLPDAHTEAPTAGSVILAGVLLKLGGYGLIRYSLPLFPNASHDLAWIVIGLSIIGIDLRGHRRGAPAGPQAAHRVLVGQPHGLRDAGHLHLLAAGAPGRRLPDGRPRHHHGRPLPPRGGHLRAHA